MTTTTKNDRATQKLNCLIRLAVKQFNYAEDYITTILTTLLTTEDRKITYDGSIDVIRDNIEDYIDYDNLMTICIWLDLINLYKNNQGLYMGYDHALKYAVKAVQFCNDRYYCYDEFNNRILELIDIGVVSDNEFSVCQSFFLVDLFLPKVGTMFHMYDLCDDIRNSDYSKQRDFYKGFSITKCLKEKGYFIDPSETLAILPQ